MLKRFISILTLAVFAYSFLGAGFVYNVWLYSVKKQVKQKLKADLGEQEEERALIKVPVSWEEAPPPEFQWHEEHEFRYRGQMYDIIRKEYHGDQVWYYAYKDEAETKLLNNLSEYVSNYLRQEPDHENENEHLRLFITRTFLPAGPAELPAPAPDFEIVPFQVISLTTAFLEIDLPPPKTALGI